MTDQPQKPPALLSLYWSRLGWRWRDDRDPAGFYKLSGNGYMSLAAATAEMERLSSGDEIPF